MVSHDKPSFTTSLLPTATPVMETSQITMNNIIIKAVHLFLYIAVKGGLQVTLSLVDGFLKCGTYGLGLHVKLCDDGHT